MRHSHYGRLVLMAVLSFISMYVLIYAMVDRFENVFPNLNQLYMAGLMTAPLVAIEILLMGAMYQNKAANLAIVAVGVIGLGTAWFFIRQQVAIGDTQFLKSMIPRHAGAILMCQKAPLQNAGIRKLCQEIVASQQSEIAQMRVMLNSLEIR